MRLRRHASGSARVGASLITVWLEVRILPAPPRSLALSEISCLLPNGPELAGSAVRILVSTETDDGAGQNFAKTKTCWLMMQSTANLSMANS